MTTDKKSYERILPNYAVHFKEYAKEWLEETGYTEEEVNDGLKSKGDTTLTDIMSTKEAITVDYASQLQSITGIPENFWVRIDAQYHKDMLRIHGENYMELEQ